MLRRVAPAAPQVSVVIPTWNRSAEVGDAVACVLAQEGPSLEVIVVDDGSTDGTAEALARRFAGEPRLTVARQANGGTARARNAGIELARGAYTALLDSDDRWLPGYLAAQVASLERSPDAALSLTDAAYVDRAGRAFTTYGARMRGRPPRSLADMLEGAWALPSCMVFRSEVLRALRFDPAWRTEDTELLFRFFAAGRRAAHVPEVLVRYAAEDPAEGAPRKMASEDPAKADQLRLMEAYAAFAPDPRAHALRLARRRALTYAREGRWREARGPAFAWWRRRPWELRALRIAVRACFARGPRP